MNPFKHRAILGLLAFAASIPLTFAAGAGAAQAPVPLGTAGSFAILAGTQVTNVPTSTISGNVGLSPATGANIIGLACAEVTGTIYKVDAAGDACFVNNPGLLTTAKGDLVLAFDNAAAQTPTNDITGVNLAGQTYGPGVYNAAGPILISGSAPLTLNGGGNADAVFIFQAAAGSDLNVVGTTRVAYTNGAQPCNVFWKVQSAMLTNTGFGFVGTILALTQITVGSNITVEGRLLARNADVTLIMDTITRPATCIRQADVDAATAAAAAAAAAATAAAEAAATAATAAKAAEVAAAAVAAEAARVEAKRAADAKAAAAKAAAAAVKAAKAADAAAVAKAVKAAKTAAAKAKAASAKAKAAAAKAARVASRAAATSARGPALPARNPTGFTG